MQEYLLEGGAHIPDNVLSGETRERLDYDCILHIISFISDGATYKSALFLNMFVHGRLATDRRKNIDRFSDHLSTLVMMYPDLPWDWRWMVTHDPALSVVESNWDKIYPYLDHLGAKNLTLDFVVKNNIWNPSSITKFGKLLRPYVELMPKHAYYSICRYILTEDDLTDPMILQMPNIFMYLSSSISPDFIFLNKDEYPWRWNIVSERRDLTEEQIKSHKSLLCPRELIRNYPIHRYGFSELVINYNTIASRPYCTIEDIKLFAPRITFWYSASSNDAISYEDIKNNPHLPWVASATATRADVSFRDAMDIFPFGSDGYSIHDLCRLCSKPNSNVDEVFARISDNERIALSEDECILTIDLIRRYPCLQNAYPNISIDDIIANMDIPWDWELISTDVTIKDVRKYPQLIGYLDWKQVSILDAMSPRDVADNPDLPWINPTIHASHYTSLTWTHFSEHFEKYKSLFEN